METYRSEQTLSASLYSVSGLSSWHPKPRQFGSWHHSFVHVIRRQQKVADLVGTAAEVERGLLVSDAWSCALVVGVGERWRDGRTAVGYKIKEANQVGRENGMDDSTEEESYHEDDDASKCSAHCSSLPPSTLPPHPSNRAKMRVAKRLCASWPSPSATGAGGGTRERVAAHGEENIGNLSREGLGR